MEAKLKKRAIHRAKILAGQMQALTQAIDDEKYCVDILLQSLSIKQSLKSLESFILENHIRTHVKHQLQQPSGENKAVEEILKIYSLSQK